MREGEGERDFDFFVSMKFLYENVKYGKPNDFLKGLIITRLKISVFLHSLNDFIRMDQYKI